MEELLRKALERIPQFHVDFADIRFFESRSTSIEVQDGRADKISTPNAYGVGVRALANGAWGFASTSLVTADELERTVEDAVSAARAAGKLNTDPGMVADIGPFTDDVSTPVKLDPREVALEDKLNVAAELEKAARLHDPQRIVNTIVGYIDNVSTEVVANTQGTLVRNEAIRTRVNVFVAAQEGQVRQSISEREGRLEGFELAQRLDPELFSVDAAQRAISLLSAENAPAGKFPVILDGRSTGLFAHEALGHNAEGDSVWTGESLLAGRVGEVLADEQISVFDDATVPGAYGSYPYDSEGTPGQKRALIEKGVLKGYMQSLESGAKLGMAPNGSGRARDHLVVPQVRMSNTYFGTGDWTLDEMLAEVKDGILFTGSQWGHVFVERGQFTMNAERGWRIRDGQRAEMLRNVSAGGSTLDVLKSIDAVSDTLDLHAAGMCGKNGQWVYVDFGGPHLRVKEMVVGGQR